MSYPKTCVECKRHKEGYMSYYCESCYRKALSENIKKEDKQYGTRSKRN